MPGSIGHPGSLLFHAGFRPHTTRGRGLMGFPPHTSRGERGGFAPTRRGPFVSAKGPKTIGAQAWPFGCLCPSPVTWAAELATLRQSSPPYRICGTGAQPRRRRRDSPFAFICHARLDRASSVMRGLSSQKNEKTTRWILACARMTERETDLGPGQSHARRRREIARLDRVARNAKK